MFPRLLVAALLASACPRPTSTAQEPTSFRADTIYTVKQQGGGLGIEVDQIVVFQLVSYRGEGVWVAEQRRHDVRMGKRTFQHQWIDGRKCDALNQVLDEIDNLPPLQFAGPSKSGGDWISDTPYVTLMGPSSGRRLGTVLMYRDLGGPISKWWRASEEALASCWQDRMVLVGDGTVMPKLNNDEAAVAAGRP